MDCGGGSHQGPERHLSIIADVATSPCARIPLAAPACSHFTTLKWRGQIWLVRFDVPVFLVGLSIFPHCHTEKPAKKELGLVQITRHRENDCQ